MSFDLRTQKFNKKGQLTVDAPYIVYFENGKEIYERPPHSGEFFYIDGTKVDAQDEPQNTHTNQTEEKEYKRAEAVMRKKVSAEEGRALNKKLKEHGKKATGDTGGVMDQPKLDSSEEAALDALVGDEEQISATQPKEKTNAEAQKKA